MRRSCGRQAKSALSVCLSVLSSCVCVSTSAFSRVSVCLSASVGGVSTSVFSPCICLPLLDVCLSVFFRCLCLPLFEVCLSTSIRRVSVCPPLSALSCVCLSISVCPSCVCLTAAVYIHIFDVNSAAITMKNDDQSAKLTQTSKLPCTQNKQAINQSTNWPVANLRPASKLSSKQSNHWSSRTTIWHMLGRG